MTNYSNWQPVDEIDPDTHCPYPKHRGVRWDLVVQRDRPYAEWLIGPDGPDTLTNGAAEAIEDWLEEGPDDDE